MWDSCSRQHHPWCCLGPWTDDPPQLGDERVELGIGERHVEQHVRVAGVEARIFECQRLPHVGGYKVDGLCDSCRVGLAGDLLQPFLRVVEGGDAQASRQEEQRIAPRAKLEQILNAAAANRSSAARAGSLALSPKKSGRFE